MFEAKLSATAKGYLLVLVPLVLALSSIAYLGFELREAERATNKIAEAQRVLMAMDELNNAVVMSLSAIMEADRRKVNYDDGMQIIIDGSKKFRESLKGFASDQVELQDCVKDSQELCERCEKLYKLMARTAADPRIARKDRAKYYRTDSYLLFIDLGPLQRRLLKLELEIRASGPIERQKETVKIISSILFLLLLNVGASVGLVKFFSRDFVERLGKVENNVARLATGDALIKPIEGNDEIAHFDNVVHEAADLLAEARRKEVAVLDHAADVIASFDKRYRFSAVGAASQKVWQYSQEELLGQQIFSIIEPSSEAQTREILDRRIDTQEPGEIENIVRCKDGSLKDTLWSVTWSPNTQTFYCVAHDITQKRALDKLKQRFVTVIGHDIHVPLSAILNSLDLLLSGARGKLEAKAADFVSQTKSHVDSLMELIQDLLDLEKAAPGTARAKTTCVSALAVCNRAIDLLDAFAAKSNIKIVRPETDAAILAEERRLVQVMTNLLSNAIKFSPDGSTITLSIKTIEKNETNQFDFVELSVADQGPGIPEEDHEKIFEKFYQSKTVTHKSIKSTGLGLSIVKELIEAYEGGKIGIESEENLGSRFWIRIKAFHEQTPAAKECETDETKKPDGGETL